MSRVFSRVYLCEDGRAGRGRAEAFLCVWILFFVYFYRLLIRRLGLGFGRVSFGSGFIRMVGVTFR